jgi:MFS family permease
MERSRLLQGFSVGGEFGSAVVFLVEDGSARKGYAASWRWASTGIISVIVALLGDTLSPSYYLMFTALLSIILLMAVQRRAAHDLV